MYLVHWIWQTVQSMINEGKKINHSKANRYYHIAYLNQAAGMTLFTFPYFNHLGSRTCCCQISTIGLTLLMCGRARVWDQCYPWRAAWLYGIHAAHRAAANSQRNAWIPLVLTLKEEHSVGNRLETPSFA